MVFHGRPLRLASALRTFCPTNGRKDMKRRRQVVTTVALIALAPMVSVPIAPLRAQEVLKIGIIGQFSGPFAVTGEQYKQGLDSYLAQNGAVASGRKLELVYRDTGGPNPAQAKRLAEELLVRDKVSILGGLYLSPEAAAAAPAVNETKTPALLFNAASPSLMEASPFFLRMGQNISLPTPLASAWASDLAKGRHSHA